MPLKKRARYELERIAQCLEIEDHQTMTKAQLVLAIRGARKTHLPDNYGWAAGTASEKYRRKLVKIKKRLIQSKARRRAIRMLLTP
jgi:hypothetical protein